MKDLILFSICSGIGIGGLSVGTGLIGRTVRLLQTGSISGYAFLVGLGVTVIIYYVVVRGNSLPPFVILSEAKNLCR